MMHRADAQTNSYPYNCRTSAEDFLLTKSDLISSSEGRSYSWRVFLGSETAPKERSRSQRTPCTNMILLQRFNPSVQFASWPHPLWRMLVPLRKQHGRIMSK